MVDVSITYDFRQISASGGATYRLKVLTFPRGLFNYDVYVRGFRPQEARLHPLPARRRACSSALASVVPQGPLALSGPRLPPAALCQRCLLPLPFVPAGACYNVRVNELTAC